MKAVTKNQINFLARMKRKKYRDLHQKFVVENPKVIWEEYANKLLTSVYVTEKFYNQHKDEMVFVNTYCVAEKDLQKISNQVTPPGMLALFDFVKPKKFNFKQKHILLLDDIQDAGNLGTIIRTADWFGFNDVFLSKDCVEIYNPKVVSATMGSIFNINIYSDLSLTKLIRDLKKEGYTIVVTDLAGDKFKLTKDKKTALIIGNEAKGVATPVKNLADQRFKILKFGQAESLNVAVSAGIIMQQIKS